MRRALLGLVLSVFMPIAGCSSVEHGPRTQPTSPEETARRLARRLAGLEQVRHVLLWHALTAQEPGHTGALAAAAPGLTFDEVFRMRRRENSPTVTDRRRRELRYLRNHLTGLLLHRRTTGLTDRHLALLRQEVELPGKAGVRVVDLPRIAAAEQDRRRGRQLAGLRVAALRRLDGLVRQKHRRVREEAERIGTSYFELMEERDERDSRGLIAAAATANRVTGERFREVLRAEAPDATALADLRFVLQGGGSQGALDRAGAVPALRQLLRGLGLELPGTLASGLATVVVPVDPPRDVRLVHAPGGGLLGHVELFEAAGQAICRAAVRAGQPWAFRNLGPQLGAMTLGHLLGLVWIDGGWWERYRRQAGVSAQDAVRLRRRAVLSGLVRLRLEGVVVPVTRAVLQGAPGAVHAGVLQGRDDPPPRIFGRLVASQLGIEPGPVGRLGYVDAFVPLAPTLDLRAYALAHQLRTRLVDDHGEGWFSRPEVGRELLALLCSAGSELTVEELVRRAGLDRLDLDAPWRAPGVGGRQGERDR